MTKTFSVFGGFCTPEHTASKMTSVFSARASPPALSVKVTVKIGSIMTVYTLVFNAGE